MSEENSRGVLRRARLALVGGALGSAGLLACGATGSSSKPPPSDTAPAFARLDGLAGQPGGPGWVDGTLVAAHFVDPWAVAGDGKGDLYVSDRDVIRKIDGTTKTVTTIAGTSGTFGGTDGPGLQATFDLPSGLVVEGANLYLTDTENHTLRVIDLDTSTVTTLAGAFGEPGAIDGAAGDARFREPEGLALDEARNLYIADTDNNTIRVLSLATGLVSTLAGAPQQVGTSDGAGAAALFNKPRGLALDASGHLYVADTGNNSVRAVDTSTGAVSTLVTLDTSPQGLGVDGSDVLATLFDDRLVRIAADGSITIVAGAAARGFVDGPGPSARFDSPAGLLNDGSGTLYTVDNGNEVVRSVSVTSGAVDTYAGANPYGHADGAGAGARFLSPQGLAVGSDSAYVADSGNHVIRAISLATAEVTTIAGAAGESGLVDGALADARFNQPEGLALDAASGLLYVADTLNHRVRRVDLGAGTVATLSPSAAPGTSFTGFDAPSGVAFDRGHLFVTDYTNEVVVAIDLAASQATTLAGQFGVASRSDGIGAAAGFYGPLGIAADGHGILFLADNQGETIRRIDTATGAVSTLAGEPVLPGTSDGVGAAAQFHYPVGIAANGVGDIFVSDSYSDTVRHIDAATAAVTTVIGVPGTQGVRLGPLPAQLSKPSAVALTATGALLVVSESAILVAH